MKPPAPPTSPFGGLISAAEWQALANAHARTTRLHVRPTDVHGTWLDDHGEPRSCSHAADCPLVRAQAIAEALRWGEPCVVCCPGERAVWGVPVMRNQRVEGGLVVTCVSLQRPNRAGSLDRRILQACQALQRLAVDHNLTNEAHLSTRRQFASREREKAEAMHELKGRLHDDIRSTYLHEEPALLAAIRRGERREARQILNRVLTAIYAAGGSHTPLLKSLALELVVIMTRAAVQAGAQPEKILGFNYQSLTTLAHVDDQEVLAAWLCQMLEQLIDAIQANVRHPNSVQLARAVEFMQEHLAEPLTRETVARAAGLSPSHFSHLMRAKTSWTFVELLTRLRTDHACHLLAHTAADLTRIALDCGFSDQSYFTRVFRRRTGQTPGDYRRARLAPAQKS
ncbi:AraC family transcriptional regulator [Opitutus sp. ER46]|uniref:AraC family transcriptional regulator n=1 Tax=Opitutus sp. ER46 TaxID=2161864 RepID=UPI000D303597|nr:AraC family transcriptional regulator [Opitutus sp. ER46]PTX92350.1 hypothetical protein DB354_13505 [Opitutus sp. ER46]